MVTFFYVVTLIGFFLVISYAIMKKHSYGLITKRLRNLIIFGFAIAVINIIVIIILYKKD